MMGMFYLRYVILYSVNNSGIIISLLYSMFSMRFPAESYLRMFLKLWLRPTISYPIPISWARGLF